MDFLTWVAVISDRDSERAFQSFTSHYLIDHPNATPQEIATAYHFGCSAGWDQWWIGRVMWKLVTFWMAVRYNRFTVR